MLAGMLLRRGIAAMVAAFNPWPTIRLMVEFLLRPHFQARLTLNCANGCSGGTRSLFMSPPVTGQVGDWVSASPRARPVYPY